MFVRRLLSKFHDFVQTQPIKSRKAQLLLSLDKCVRVFLKLVGQIQGGAWSGNDTCWRMAVDLARALIYSDRQGKMCNDPQRKHIILIDGIIGGEGDGPLSPKPIRSGIVLFSDNIVYGDMIGATVMGHDFRKFAIIREALNLKDFSLIDSDCHSVSFYFNGESVDLISLQTKIKRTFELPRGWKRYSA